MAAKSSPEGKSRRETRRQRQPKATQNGNQPRREIRKTDKLGDKATKAAKSNPKEKSGRETNWETREIRKGDLATHVSKNVTSIHESDFFKATPTPITRARRSMQGHIAAPFVSITGVIDFDNRFFSAKKNRDELNRIDVLAFCTAHLPSLKT